MIDPRTLELQVLLSAVALATTSCTAAPAKPATTAAPMDETIDSSEPSAGNGGRASPPPMVVRRDIKDGVAVASDWLDALARRDIDALARESGFPFAVHYSGQNLECAGSNAAATEAELPSALSCLTSDPTLIGVLQKHTSGGLDALRHGEVQPWAKQWQGELRPEWRLVTAYFERGDATVELNLVVASDGVRAVWKAQGLDATVEARLAVEWLAALREGDVSSLARVTRFPFELRDRGRTSKCGTRTAIGPDALDEIVRCLTSNKVFQQALGDSSELRLPIVYRSADQLPGWAHALWDKQGAPALEIVSFLVTSKSGNEFDLLLLTDEVGVHALWKSGSLESTD